ncbi:MAG TPA: transporter [Candidatus Sulfotelmatobacter sp.]|nr:transporter [Candidatus Sulfotelmatobacter sp.]
MQTVFQFGLLLFIGVFSCQPIPGQDLAPRAYVVTPLHSNAVTLTYSYSDGGVLFNGQLPVPDATAQLHVPILTYFHSFNFFGRSANVTASLPYSAGHFQGTFQDNETNLYRSGLLDTSFRVSINLRGGPAMSVQEFRSWKHKTILGLSLRVVAPTGQYDATRLINNGSNRWSFKPEFGVSRRWGHWVLEAYSGVWFFTTNSEYWSHNSFYPGTRSQSQAPIGSLEGHLSYDLKPRLWLSLDSNFWYGGRTTVNGVENTKTLQKNSRIGVTASVPVSKHESLKFSYSTGAYVHFGGDFRMVSVAWQYSWLGRPN